MQHPWFHWDPQRNNIKQQQQQMDSNTTSWTHETIYWLPWMWMWMWMWTQSMNWQKKNTNRLVHKWIGRWGFFFQWSRILCAPQAESNRTGSIELIQLCVRWNKKTIFLERTEKKNPEHCCKSSLNVNMSNKFRWISFSFCAAVPDWKCKVLGVFFVKFRCWNWFTENFVFRNYKVQNGKL